MRPNEPSCFMCECGFHAWGYAGELYITIVSPEDALLLRQRAVRTIKTQRQRNGYVQWGEQYLHRIIIRAPRNRQVDHINGNSLDNRRENLRLATCQQNSGNRGQIRRSPWPYKGVRQRKPDGPWTAQIGIDYGLVYLGSFKTSEDAARAYDDAASAHYGEFASLNFKGNRDE